MNILVLNWQDIRNPLGGGAEVHLHEIFKRIASRGHSVTLFCSAFPGCLQEEMIDGITVIRRGSRNLFNFYVPSWYSKLVRESRYDVVVDDLNKIPFYSPLFVREPLVGIIHHLFGKSIFLETNLPSALYVAATERLGLRIYRDSIIAAVSESTRDELITKGFQEHRIHLVPIVSIIASITRPNVMRIHTPDWAILVVSRNIRVSITFSRHSKLF